MSKIFSIEQKNIFIVGAASGIGYHSAKLFSGLGANLILADLHKKELDVLADEIRKTGVQVETHFIDVTQLDTIADALSKMTQKIDVSLNTTGISVRKPILEQTAEDWDRVMAVNLKGTWALSQAVIKHMIAKKSKGKIINISSVYGGVTNYDSLIYAVSKAGTDQLTRALALECAAYGIRVNAIAPTYIETPLSHDALSSIRDYVISRTPLGRIGKLDDLDGVLVLLASDAADYITGTIFQVDGGNAVHRL